MVKKIKQIEDAYDQTQDFAWSGFMHERTIEPGEQNNQKQRGKAVEPRYRNKITEDT